VSPPDVYLASTSPRRRELLAQLGVDFALLSQAVAEQRRPGEEPAALAQRLALEKARAGWQSLAPFLRRPVLGADTLVEIDGLVLGKPADADEARAMLARLAGRRHRVLSAVALAGLAPAATGNETAGYSVRAGEALRLSESTVSLRDITPAEAAAYWASGEPADKAGGYAIQGRGAVFVRHLSGSYSGVMGLPLFETAELLRLAGINILE